MPTFEVTDPKTGRVVELQSEDNTPPTEQELEDVFSNIGSNEKPVESIMNNGLDYVKQHPFKTAFQGAAQTITGKSAQDYALEATAPTENDIRPNDPLSYNMAFAKNALAGMAGSAVDMATSPANYVLGPLLQKAAVGAAKVAGNVGNAITRGRMLKEALKAKDVQLMDSQRNLNTIRNEFGAIRDEDIVRKINETVDTTRDISDKYLEKMNVALDQKVNEKLPVFREALKKYFSNNSKLYGDRLDKISDRLAKSGESITRGEFKQLLDDVVSDSNEQFLTSGKPMEEIQYLQKKYLPSFETGAPNGMASTFKGMQKPRFNADDQLNFREVVEDIKKVKNALSSKVKMGYRYQPEDIVAAKLMGRWGDYVATKVPEFSGLNKEYKPIIDAMNAASKEFKPYESDFNIKGAKALKDLAMGRNSGVVDKDKLLQFIETGSENFPGVGNFTSDIRNIGSRINQTKNETNLNINDLMRRKSEAQDTLSKHKELLDQKNEILQSIAQRKEKIKKATRYTAGAFGLEETFGPGYVRKNILGR